jgi:hypothetical protein
MSSSSSSSSSHTATSNRGSLSTTTADAIAERRRIMANLVKAAMEGRLRVNGRVHTGGARPEFVGTVFPPFEMTPGADDDDDVGHSMTLEITSLGRFTARLDGLSKETVLLEVDGVDVESDISSNSVDGGVWVHINAESADYAWLWLELYAPSPASATTTTTTTMRRVVDRSSSSSSGGRRTRRRMAELLI